MILITCADDRMGMLFNHRRLSRDKAVLQDMLTVCDGASLYASAFSQKLLADFPGEQLRFTENFSAGELAGQYVFLEEPERINESAVEKLILYRWNRKYPADQHFPFSLTNWHMTSSSEFAGNSHERITKEVYERN